MLALFVSLDRSHKARAFEVPTSALVEHSTAAPYRALATASRRCIHDSNYTEVYGTCQVD